MNSFRFKIVHKDNKTSAKLGLITTSHGNIETPAFVPVGTASSIKSLTSEEIKKCYIDVFFVNTYHMIFRPGLEVIKKYNGLHNFMNWPCPLITDSGGFQAFSLGEHGPRNQDISTPEKLVKISDQGILFKSVWDGSKNFLGPDESVEAQKILHADIMMAFDECTFYPISRKRAIEASNRTHEWAEKCLRHKLHNQALYGIIQGSVFKNLRIKSAKFISSLPFSGFAIGSVANSKEPRNKVFQVLDWTIPILQQTNKPIHFLGIGEIEDILISVEKGIDSFDCVIPTRLARMGWIFSKEPGKKNKFRYDLNNKTFSTDKSSLEKNCKCFTCKNFTKGYLYHLLRCKELLYYRLASIHNLTFYGRLMKEIRASIFDGRFHKYKEKLLNS